jgi:hypothetical protein
MTWKFHVLATAQRRLFSRILQTLESQMVVVDSFAGEANEGEACVIVILSSEENKAFRIKALLYRLEGVRSVSVSIE